MKTRIVLVSISGLAALVLSGCAGQSQLPPSPMAPQMTLRVEPQDSSQAQEVVDTPSPQPELTQAAPPTATAKAFDQCPVTSPTQGHPTDTDIFGDVPSAEWYCSPDEELCAVKSGPWPAGGWKVGWRKPSGATLEVSGRRLDAAAPPLGASVPDGYWGTFQSSGLIFPTEGCWEVEAQAEESVLRFVVEVVPPQHPPHGGSCETLADVVKNSDHIMVGWVQASDPGPEGRCVWQTVRVRRVWKNPHGDQIQLLQDTGKEPALEEGHTYLVFTQRDPFQLFCPKRTLAEVIGDYPDNRLISLGDEADDQTLWVGDSLAEVEAEIRALLSSSLALQALSSGLRESLDERTAQVPVTATPAPPRLTPTALPPEALALPTASPAERKRASNTWLYVWSFGPSTIAVVDPESGHALHDIPFEGHAPGVAVAPDGSRLYVVDGIAEGRLRVFDTASWQLVRQEPVADRAVLKWGNPVSLSGDGRWLLVEHYSHERDQAGVSIFDTRALEFLARGTAGWSQCAGASRLVQLEGLPNHERLYAQCGDSVIALDATALAPLWEAPSPSGPTYELALAPDGEQLYGLFPQVAVTYEGGYGRVGATGLQLWSWEASTGQIVQDIRLSDQLSVPTATFGRGDRGYLAVAPDGSQLYVAWEDRLWALSRESLQVTGELVLPASVDGTALSSDGRELYLLPATAGDLRVREHGLWIVDTATLELAHHAADWPQLSLPFMLAAPAPA